MMTTWYYRNSWLLPAMILAGIVCGITVWAVAATGEASPYPLDDTFIHLAMARNLANGHWGITKHAFSNASTSPVYVGVLALLGKAGLPWIWLPLGINLLSAVGLLVV